MRCQTIPAHAGIHKSTPARGRFPKDLTGPRSEKLKSRHSFWGCLWCWPSHFPLTLKLCFKGSSKHPFNDCPDHLPLSFPSFIHQSLPSKPQKIEEKKPHVTTLNPCQDNSPSSIALHKEPRAKSCGFGALPVVCRITTTTGGLQPVFREYWSVLSSQRGRMMLKNLLVQFPIS